MTDFNYASAGYYLTELVKDLGMTEEELATSMNLNVNFRDEFAKYSPVGPPKGSEAVTRLYTYVQYLKPKLADASLLRAVLTAQVLPILPQSSAAHPADYTTISLMEYAQFEEAGWVANVELALEHAQNPRSDLLLTATEQSELTPEEVSYIEQPSAPVLFDVTDAAPVIAPPPPEEEEELASFEVDLLPSKPEQTPETFTDRLVAKFGGNKKNKGKR